MSGRVFVAGSANIDLVATVGRLPNPGETVLANGFAILPGGKGANQAVAAAKAGSKVSFFGCVGRDAFGDKVVAVLTAAGVDVSCLGRSATATGTALISVDADGQNQIAVFPGANAELRFHDAFGQAAYGDVLLAQSECPVDVVFEYCKAAKSQGVMVILNPAPVAKLSGDHWDLADVLVVNEEEAAQYRAQFRPDDHHPEVHEIARQLRTRSDQVVIITMGENGVLGLVGDQAIRLPAHTVKAVDTTGAGDCFCGYLASGLASGRSIEEAIKLANAAAGLAVQRKGAAVAMPDKAEVLSFLEADANPEERMP